jgi:cobalt-zinc-cadmium efflux system outer membrane protein
MAAILMPLNWLRAQEATVPATLSLSDSVRIALERNPAVRAAQSSIGIAEAVRLDKSRRLNPAATIESEGWRAFSGDQGPFFQNQELTARLDYEIETGGKRRLRTEVADLGVQTAQASFEDQRRRLALEVERTYSLAVLARANLEVAQNILGEMDRIIQLNQIRFTRGEISGGEFRRSEVERLRFHDDVFASQLELRNAKSELLALLYFPNQLGQDFELSDSLPVDSMQGTRLLQVSAMTLQQLQARAIQQRPDLQAAAFEQQRADTETLHQRAIRSPNVTVGAGYKRDGPFNALVIGATVPLGIFNRNEGGVARAEAELSRVRSEQELTRTSLLLEVQRAYNAVRLNQQRVRYIEDEYLQKSEQSRQTVTASYQLGEANLIDLLDAERAYRETRRIHNQALYDYRISLYELVAAVKEDFLQ